MLASSFARRTEIEALIAAKDALSEDRRLDAKVEGSPELKEVLKRPGDRKKVSADSIRHTEVKKLAKLNKSLELQMRSPRMRSSPSKKGGRGGGRNRRVRDNERTRNKNINNNNRNDTNNASMHNKNQQLSVEQQSDTSKPYQQP